MCSDALDKAPTTKMGQHMAASGGAAGAVAPASRHTLRLPVRPSAKRHSLTCHTNGVQRQACLCLKAQPVCTNGAKNCRHHPSLSLSAPNANTLGLSQLSHLSLSRWRWRSRVWCGKRVPLGGWGLKSSRARRARTWQPKYGPTKYGPTLAEYPPAVHYASQPGSDGTPRL